MVWQTIVDNSKYGLNIDILLYIRIFRGYRTKMGLSSSLLPSYRGSLSTSLQVRVMNILENPTLYREIKSGAYSGIHFFFIFARTQSVGTR